MTGYIQEVPLVDVPALRAALNKDGVDPQTYRILDLPGEGTWCIRKQGETWLVFYFERGAKWELQRFKSETSACEYFLNRITHG